MSPAAVTQNHSGPGTKSHSARHMHKGHRIPTPCSVHSWTLSPTSLLIPQAQPCPLSTLCMNGQRPSHSSAVDIFIGGSLSHSDASPALGGPSVRYQSL